MDIRLETPPVSVMSWQNFISLGSKYIVRRRYRDGLMRSCATPKLETSPVDCSGIASAPIHSEGRSISQSDGIIKDPALSPKLYRSGNWFQRRDSIEVLAKLENKFKTVANNEQQYLDIGCASGDFTLEVLLKRSGPCRRIVAVDVSPEMIDYARHQSHHPKISYDVLDIAASDVSGFVFKYGQFDRIYSFFCLHWVKDQTAALRNVSTFLKSDGQCLLLFAVNTGLYTIWRDIMDLPRWKTYTKGFDNFITSTQDISNTEDAENYIRAALQQARLVPDFCELYRTQWDFETIRDIMGTIAPVIPVVSSRMPENEKEDYYNDLLDIVSKRCSRSSSGFRIESVMCVIQASKLRDIDLRIPPSQRSEPHT